MSWTLVADVVAALCILVGGLLTFAAGVGLLRFPDLLARLHTATKPQSLGLILALIGLALRIRDVGSVWILILVVLFQMLTSPVAAHMVGRAGYRTGKVRREFLVVDEMTEDLEAARRTMGESEPLSARPGGPPPAPTGPAGDGSPDERPGG